MNKLSFIQQIKAASKAETCDLVIKNITIIDVFQNNSFISDVAVKNGYIVGLGEYEGTTTIDGTGKYICPGLIDGHAHIESSLTTPNQYYKAALLHGITSIVTDPHEVANVLGIPGIELMFKLSENIPFDFYFMLPSCVPATSFENSGAVLESDDLFPLYNNPRVLGLAEVMNFPALLNCDENMITKLWDARSKGLIIDGHGACFDKTMLNAYTTANVVTDHECSTAEGLIDRIRRGMYVLIREGTVAKNLKDLITATSLSNSRRICLCTDDKHIDDLIENGSIDNSIKMIINYGLKPETAIQLATLNTAECYGLKHKGAIAPGYIADFVILDDLNTFKINSVYKNGNLVVKNNKLITNDTNNSPIISLENSINLPSLSEESFKIDITSKSILNVIEIIPNKLESNHLKININELEKSSSKTEEISLSELKVNTRNEFISSTTLDLLKVAVIERHNATGNIGLGILRGLKLNSGAIATTIAHDSHNMIVCGTTDSDMLFATEELKKIKGGIIVVQNKTVLASIQLEIGGLITSRESEDVINDINKLHSAINEISPNINFNPFLTLSFLSLPVIPNLKITDKGLFDVSKFEFIPVVE